MDLEFLAEGRALKENFDLAWAPETKHTLVERMFVEQKWLQWCVRCGEQVLEGEAPDRL